jgi:hypothetical protein
MMQIGPEGFEILDVSTEDGYLVRYTSAPTAVVHFGLERRTMTTIDLCPGPCWGIYSETYGTALILCSHKMPQKAKPQSSRFRGRKRVLSWHKLHFFLMLRFNRSTAA